MLDFNIIAAIGRSGQLGLNGGIPWLEPLDLQHFRDLTYGHAVIMGRRTWDSLKAPLKGRVNLMVSSTHPHPRTLAVTVYPSLDRAFYRAQLLECEAWVIGGAKLYEEALAHKDAGLLFLTRVDYDGPADVFFPMDALRGWRVREEETHRRGSCVFEVWECAP